MAPHAAADPRGSENAPATFGDTPNNQPELVAQSHERSRSYGLRPYESPDLCPVLHSKLETEVERSRSLFTHALPVMEALYSQIVDMQSMVILTDTSGLALHSLGDDDFLARASKMTLQPGTLWSETNRGASAIDTALAEAKPMLVHGSEHYLQTNQFLAYSCAPIFDPYSATVDTLGVTGDHRSFHRHTMALVRMSAQVIGNRSFAGTFQDVMCIHFHSRPKFINTLVEGVTVFTPTGRFLSANRSGEFQFGLSIRVLHAHTFSSLFGLSMSQLIDHERTAAAGIVQLQLPNGVKVSARIERKRPTNRMVGGAIDADLSTSHDAALYRACIGPIRRPANLEALDIGDAQIQTVVGKLRKVIGKGIPVMILDETDTSKELLAHAIHAGSPHHAGPFTTVNCASIPEAFIGSELFGYEEGVFTGARKRSGIGKMVLANDGTLFLDEIGNISLHLQARLLRTLQERAVSPLSSNKLIQVDVTVVCATHHNTREMVASGQFREDLYYRLNGLAVRLPALREHSDLNVIVDKLLELEQADMPLISEAVMQMFRSYHWPGDIHQPDDLLCTVRLMAEGASEVTEDHLPDDFLEDWQARHGDQPPPDNAVTSAAAVPPVTQDVSGTQPKRLADAESITIVAVVQAHSGNVFAAAGAFGISHNTIYRRIGETDGLPSDAD